MTLNEYQERAMTTCMPESKNFSYMFMNLVGEVGEIASKVSKHIRKGECNIYNNNLYMGSLDDEQIHALQMECGDVMWQISGLCSVMGWKLEDIGQQNLDKLQSRKERGVIASNGDNR